VTDFSFVFFFFFTSHFIFQTIKHYVDQDQRECVAAVVACTYTIRKRFGKGPILLYAIILCNRNFFFRKPVLLLNKISIGTHYKLKAIFITVHGMSIIIFLHIPIIIGNCSYTGRIVIIIYSCTSVG
jgi:hypothetical protein